MENNNPFCYDVEDLESGDFFQRDFSLTETPAIPKDILNLVEPDFAIRFETIPVAFDTYGTFYAVTTSENMQPFNLSTIFSIQNFLAKHWNVNCNFLQTSKKNIRFALEKYFNFSEENLRRAYVKFYDFEQLAFNDFGKMVDWAKKFSGHVIKNSLVTPPLSNEVEKNLKFVSASMAIRFSLIPVKLEDNGVLLLLTSSSRTFDSVEDISKMLNVPCRIFLTLDKNIRDALEKFYHFDNLNENFSKRTDFDFLFDNHFVDWRLLDRDFSPEILQTVPFDVALKFSVIPLGFNSDGKLVLVTNLHNTSTLKNSLSDFLNVECKILRTDVDSFADALQTAFALTEKFPEPLSDFANVRWQYMIRYNPNFLMELQKAGKYDDYFKNVQTDSAGSLETMVHLHLQRENIAENDTGSVENIRAAYRELLNNELGQ